MKKCLALLFALLFLLSAASAEPLREGFEADTVISAVLKNANAVLGDAVTAVPGNGEGKYSLLYKGQDMGVTLYLCHKDAAGALSGEGALNHMAVSLQYATADVSTDAYVIYWAAIAGAAVQYLSGAAQMGELPTALYEAMKAAAGSSTCSADYALPGYTAKVLAMSKNDITVVGLVADIQGLY